MEGGAKLSAHSKGAVELSRVQLAQVPTPQGTWSHKPVPHADLVDTLTSRLNARGWEINREKFAVNQNGMKLFGVMDLNGTGLWHGNGGAGAALGFRAANDKSLAIQVVAGARIFVCDNMAFSGESIILARKHTRGLSLTYEVDKALEKYFKYMRHFEDSVNRARETHLDDDAAKRMIFDLFYQGVLSQTLFEGVAKNYFKADMLGYEDCSPRTAWGLHNSATRALKDLTVGSQFRQTVGLGRFFGLGKDVDPLVPVN